MYFNNKVSTSKATLPLTITYVVVVLLCVCMVQQNLLFTALCTFVVGWFVEMVNIKNVLIRGYSRLTVCLFLLLSLVTIRLTPLFVGAVMQLLFILYLYYIFQTYQNRHAPAVFFLAYVLIGIISLWFVQILFFLPFLWLMTIFWLQALSVRNFFASLLGILLPYLFWSMCVLYFREPTEFVGHFEELASFEPLCVGVFESHLFVATVALMVLNAIGIVHYLLFSSNESIKNRMLHYMIFAISGLAFVFLILQPQYADFLLRLLVLTTSMSLAHYFTIAKDRVAHYLFLLFLLLILVATIFVIWNF